MKKQTRTKSAAANRSPRNEPGKREQRRRETQSKKSERGVMDEGLAAMQPLGGQKKSARKRSANGGLGSTEGAPTQHQDPKRRLGNFKSAGEASRKGGRSKGIVGHHKQNARKS